MKKMRNDSHRSGPVRNWYILHPSTQLKLQQFIGRFLLHATAAGWAAIISLQATSGKIKTLFLVLNPDPLQ
jgi:hypothetical protein